MNTVRLVPSCSGRLRLISYLAEHFQGTFREHSGNIQGTFREHSGNIQGTSAEADLVPGDGSLRGRDEVPRVEEHLALDAHAVRAQVPVGHHVTQPAQLHLTRVAAAVAC
eukprot:2807559-Pyramimonas_sp.AAC.1